MQHEGLVCILDREDPPNALACTMSQVRFRLLPAGEMHVDVFPDGLCVWSLWEEADDPPTAATDWINQFPPECLLV